MLRDARRAIGVGALLAVMAGGARAQYYGYPAGYAGYGWGGWGGGGTVQGDIARGLGAFAYGAGQYNVNNAQAAAINADTAMRWNQANWATQHAINISYYYRRLRRRERVNKYAAETYDRLRNHPNEYDVENGDALNVALDELLNPTVFGSAVRTIRTPLSPSIIRDIPFQHATEAVTICLHQLTAEDGWPPALRGQDFAPERKGVQDAIQEALAEDEKQELTPQTIQKVTDAVNRLNNKFQATVPTDSPDYIPARDYIKTLFATSRMLHSPQVEEILAGLEKYPGTTAGDLLAFMHAFNLRFAPANTPRQRTIYQQLFPILDQERDKALGEPKTKEVLAETEQAAESAGKSLGSAASSFFKGMGWEHATAGGNKPKPPQQ